MISVSNKEACCGCSACYNICPKGCITMQSDDEGFSYPSVDLSKCVHCGLCDRTCPIINKPQRNDNIIKAFSLRSTDEVVLDSSTSGGFVTSLIMHVINKGGEVCTATYDDKHEICHKIFNSTNIVENIERIRGSKYVQSDMGMNYKTVKELLDAGKVVCFIGTPCQVGGLLSFTGKEYSNLITVDLVCHGVSSPELWRKYLTYQTSKNSADIKSINFRNKTYGYHSGTMKITFKNGKSYYGSGRVDPMLKSFFSEISSRPSCYSCTFKGVNRFADFTIFDCWHSSELTLISDDDKGYTNLLINSQKGSEIWEKIKDNYLYYEVNPIDAIEKDGIMVENSAKPHPNRTNFYKDMDSMSISEMVKRYIPIKGKDYLIEKAKYFLYKIGLMKFVKKMKRE